MLLLLTAKNGTKYQMKTVRSIEVCTSRKVKVNYINVGADEKEIVVMMMRIMTILVVLSMSQSFGAYFIQLL